MCLTGLNITFVKSYLTGINMKESDSTSVSGLLEICIHHCSQSACFGVLFLMSSYIENGTSVIQINEQKDLQNVTVR